MVDYWIKSSNIGSIFIPKRTIDSLLLYKSVLKSSQVFSSHVISCIALAHKYFDTSLKMPIMLAHWKNMQFLWPKYWQSTNQDFFICTEHFFIYIHNIMYCTVTELFVHIIFCEVIMRILT